MSEDSKETTFDNKCNILSELWVDYRDEEDLADFISYNDLGLPLGFLVAESLVTPSQRAKDMIEETFVLLLASLEVDDAGFESFDELMLG
jgi:hypothetical protein